MNLLGKIETLVHCANKWSRCVCICQTATAPLATSTTACRFQGCCLGIPVSYRPRTCLSVPLRNYTLTYLADDCQLTADASACRLCSADTAKCVVCRMYNNFGDRCFAAAGPLLQWNTLPLNLRLCGSLGQFKRSLKTFLFGLWDHSALWH